MNSRGQRKPLPEGLRPGASEFFAELRHVVDTAGLTTRELERRTSTVRVGTATPAFYSKSQWGRWLNGQAVPPRRAVQHLAAVLEAAGVDVGRLLALHRWTVIPVQRTRGERDGGEQDENERPPRQVPFVTPEFADRAGGLADLDRLVALSLLTVAREAAGDLAAARRSRAAAAAIIDGWPSVAAARFRAWIEREVASWPAPPDPDPRAGHQ